MKSIFLDTFSVSFDLESLSSSILNHLFKKNPLTFGLSVIKSLEKKIQTVSTQEDDKISFRYITPIFKAISQPIEDRESSIKVLVESVVVCQYPFQLKNGWAGLVLNAKLDPSLIVSENCETFMKNIYDITKSANLVNKEYYR